MMSKYFCRIIVGIALMVFGSACHNARKTAATADYGRVTPPTESKEAKMMTKAHGRVVDEAMKWLGSPYRYGGQSRKGTDCSGMVMQVYLETTGIKLPRNSREQCDFCKDIKRSDIVPGDLVFFTDKKGGGKVGHVGIYLGKGRFIHSSSSKGVVISSLDTPYYAQRYYKGGRVPGM